MAVTALSGQRWQGSSTFATSGKLAGTSGTGSVYANWGRESTNDNLSYDLGATLSETAWVMRFKLYIDTFTLPNGSGCKFYFGMSDSDADTSSQTGQDSITFQIKFASSASEQNLKGCAGNGGEMEQYNAEMGTNMLTSSADTTYYVELKRTADDVATISIGTNSDFSTGRTSATIPSISSGISGLQYVVAKIFIGSDVGNHVYGDISEVQICNGLTTFDSGDITYNVGEFMKATTGWKINDSAIQNIIPISPTDEKTTVTDVPVGSEFEQTDDYKSYQRAGSAISLTGLKAYFTMGEASGDLINRASEYGSTDAIANFDLSVTGATQNVSGKYNKCVSFSGNQSAVADDSSLSDTAFLSNNGAAWTICFWTSVEGLASGGNIEGDQAWFATSGFGTDQNGVMCRVAATVAPPSNPAYTSMLIGTTGDDKVSGTSSASGLEDLASPTGWHFIAVQYDDSTGIARDMKDNSGTWNNIITGANLTNTDTPSAKFRLAQWGDNDNNLNGDMEAVSIWNRILTADELTSLYTSTAVGQGLTPSWIERGTAI